ncbi:MAG: hypothetical protein ACRC3B_11765 [Bacteroidia bacterium]
MKIKSGIIISIAGFILLAGIGYVLFPYVLSFHPPNIEIIVNEVTQPFLNRIGYSIICAIIPLLTFITVALMRQFTLIKYFISFILILSGHLLGLIVNSLRLEKTIINNIPVVIDIGSMRIQEYAISGMIVMAIISFMILRIRNHSISDKRFGRE